MSVVYWEYRIGGHLYVGLKIRRLGFDSLYVKNVTQFTFAALFPLVNIGLMLFVMFDIIDNLDIMNKKIKL